jgi:hypothetical protein
MDAVEKIEQLHAAGLLKRVTSKWSRIEEARCSDPDLRAAFAANDVGMSAVTNDHVVLGFTNIDYGYRGFITYPNLTDIVDEVLFAKLRAVPLKETDAKHVMLAAANNCQFFVTKDERDLLPVRAEIETVCSLRIVRPTEFMTEWENNLKLDHA